MELKTFIWMLQHRNDPISIICNRMTHILCEIEIIIWNGCLLLTKVFRFYVSKVLGNLQPPLSEIRLFSWGVWLSICRFSCGNDVVHRIQLKHQLDFVARHLLATLLFDVCTRFGDFLKAVHWVSSHFARNARLFKYSRPIIPFSFVESSSLILDLHIHFSSKWTMIAYSDEFESFRKCHNLMLFFNFIHGEVGGNLEGVRIPSTIIACELFFNGSCLNKISHLQMLVLPYKNTCLWEKELQCVYIYAHW